MTYFKSHYGCDHYFCDNAWKQRQRYNDRHGDTFIFNYGCGGGHGYGVHHAHRGGGFDKNAFWGGFGAGIGNGLANMLSGFLGGFTSMPFFGGGMFSMSMPMFSMPSFGMPMFGMQIFSIGGGTTASTTKADKPRVLGGGEKVTEEAQGAIVEGDPEDKLKEVTDKLGDKNKPLEATDVERLLDPKTALTKDQETKLVSKLETELSDLKSKDEDNTYKCTKDYDTLRKLELLCKYDSNVKVGVETRTESKNDPWIKGKITDVKLNNGVITYNVECNCKECAILGATYKLEQSGDGKTCKPVSATVDIGGETHNIVLNAVIYNWDDTQGCWVNKTDKPTVSKELQSEKVKAKMP